ncbi:hypothetical protein RJ640_027223 [Escallonia rubra]|uniref:Ycf49-like protein n=1 Tax=Escallonia rubra TaxID=112253 RepID=A0AA88RGD4_9ASTE|nr:hypothetical protein RJ640_027223 [Escallonia rubra]
MAAPILLSPLNTFYPHTLKRQTLLPSPTKPRKSRISAPINRTQTLKNPSICSIFKNHKAIATILGAGLAVSAIVSPASAAELPLLGSSLQLSEPSNALSLPTWAIHVSSVVEWIIAMALVWQYAEESGYESWKGLSWGMVPLLGGAFCACTWHFFYNSESLESSIVKHQIALAESKIKSVMAAGSVVWILEGLESQFFEGKPVK